MCRQISWAGGSENFGHLVFEQVLRVHTLLSLDAQDTTAPGGGGDGGVGGSSGYGGGHPSTTLTSLADGTLLLLLWGCDMSGEHGGPSPRGWYRLRWQAAPTAFGPTDGPGSPFRQWMRLFSSHEPVCLGALPSGVGFRRLHVGDTFLDHFTSLGAKPTQYHAFSHHVAAVTRRMCRRERPSWAPPVGRQSPDEALLDAARRTDGGARADGRASARLPLVVALEKAEGRRRPRNLGAAVATLRRRLAGSARVALVRGMNATMPVCEQLGWLQAADVLITPAGGISVASAFLKPGASVISFGGE